jgi:hypothetical protein
MDDFLEQEDRAIERLFQQGPEDERMEDEELEKEHEEEEEEDASPGKKKSAIPWCEARPTRTQSKIYRCTRKDAHTALTTSHCKRRNLGNARRSLPCSALTQERKIRTVSRSPVCIETCRDGGTPLHGRIGWRHCKCLTVGRNGTFSTMRRARRR